MGAPNEWLTGYIGALIKKREIYSLEHTGQIIGTCEIRKSITAPKYADIRMVVSPEHRRKGYGTFILKKAITIA